MTARPLGPAGLRSFPAAHRPTEEPVEEREPAERIQAEPQQPFTFEAPPRNEVSDEPAARSWLAEPQRATADEASEPAPEPQLYMYDPTGGAPSSSRRGLLIAVIILLLVGIAGVFYLMNSSPKKTAPTKSSSSNIGVTLTPSTAELEPGNAIDLTATVTNGNGTEVGWVVEEGNTAGQIVPRGAEMQGDGSIQLKAVYVAPQQTGTYHVTVTSKADDSKSAQSVIKVARKQ